MKLSPLLTLQPLAIWFLILSPYYSSVHAQPPNDDCSNAITVAIPYANDDDSSEQQFAANITGATSDLSIATTCDGVSVTAPGVWYKIDGTGSKITVDTCNLLNFFDTKLHVYRGSACGSLDCVGANDDSDGPFCGGIGSLISWQSVPGITYYILLSGHETDPFVHDLFETVPLLFTLDRPLNAFCHNPKLISSTSTISGTTNYGTLLADSSLSPDSCTSITAPGLWYMINGTGGTIKANTCSPQTDYDTKLHVFTGDYRPYFLGYCPFGCVTSNDDSSTVCGSSSTKSAVTWESVYNTTYYILVSGYNTLTGKFGLSVEIIRPPNDSCNDAVLISSTSTTFGNTRGATNEPSTPLQCSNYRIGAPGVWYKIHGVGGIIKANTCSSYTDYYTMIHVYSGICGSLDCVTANNHTYSVCGYGSTGSAVSWLADGGETYYVLVNGNSNDMGNFQLDVELFPPPNDDCANATTIITTSVTRGSTEIATTDSNLVSTCNSLSPGASGVWYKVGGTGLQISANTCSNTDFDTMIHVYSGSDCGALTCITANDDSSTVCGSNSDRSAVTWNSVVGTTYYIFVSGYDSHTGNFELAVEINYHPPPNDVCDNAILISSTSATTGTTVGASSDSVIATTCNGVNVVAPGVWYKIIGTGGIIKANTCLSDTDFDTRIHVYSGSSCGSLACITGNDDHLSCEDNRSAVTWDSAVGTTYYIFVSGGYATGSIGNFRLAIGIVRPPNDSCSNAVMISSTSTTVGTTVAATSDLSSAVSCNSISVTAPGVWYKINGTGGTIKANTCSNTDYDTKIHVYSGSACGDLTCVTANDNSVDVCGTSSSSAVLWESEGGTTYYVLINGYGEFTGSFELAVELVPPPNNDYANAIPISSTSVTSGSTMAATDDSFNNIHFTNCFCVDLVEDEDESIVDPDFVDPLIPGVWYKVLGTGQTINANTCSYSTFDTKIQVYNGYSDCVTWNDDSNERICGYPYGRSEVTWESDLGRLYYIFVNGQSEKGFFDLTVEFVPPPNDNCADAITVSSALIVSGSTLFATSDSDAATSCNGLDVTAPGVWYKYIGTGEQITITIVPTDGLEYDYDIVIHVYSGSVCGELSCVTADGIICEDNVCVTANDGVALPVFIDYPDGRIKNDPLISWPSVVGTTYYVFVSGWNGATGIFSISFDLASLPDSPSNDECANAINISALSSISGTTVDANIDSGVPTSCDGVTLNKKGVWYKIIGTGETINANTCSSNQDNKIHVYSGNSCGDLVCVTADYKGCSGPYLGSAVTWVSVIGTPYYILVSDGDIPILSDNSFQLVVEKIETIINDFCENAITISSTSSTSGTIEGATIDSSVAISCNGVTVTSPGVWYKITGTGGTIYANSCFNTYDTKIHVYSGSDCGALTCVIANDDSESVCGDCGSAVSWESAAGTTYYILVNGWSTGDFDLAVTISGGADADAGGDPHFNDWFGHNYQFHGECDLVMIHNPQFGNGLGLDVYARLTRDHYYSFINELALRIGSDVLEFHSLGEFKRNGIPQSIQNTTEETVAGYPLAHWHSGKVYFHRYYIKLGESGEKIEVKCFENIIYLEVKGGSTNIFKNSVGFLGDSNTGKMIGRDGETVFDTAEDFATEWQVRDTDIHLFEKARYPQWPEQCLPANKFAPRLGEATAREEAETICTVEKWGNKRDQCTFDVIATRNKNIAGLKDVEEEAIAEEQKFATNTDSSEGIIIF